MYLLDANVLIYAFRKDSPFHQACYVWLTGALEGNRTVLSPAIVEVAFVRLNTLPSLKDKAAPPADVFAFLADLHALPSYQHAPASKAVIRRWRALCESYKLVGNDVNDAYLAALALEHGATLVSADRGFGRFSELGWVNPVEQTTL